MKRFLPLVLALTAAVLSFAIARAVTGGGDLVATGGELPYLAETAVVVVPVAFDGDPREAAAALLDDELAGRLAASVEDVTIEESGIGRLPGPGVGGISPPSFAVEPDLSDALPDADVGDDEPPFAVGGGGGGSPDDGAIDLCAEPEAPEGCPDGVGGFILLGIHSLPPYEGGVSISPFPPGGAPSIRQAECEPLVPELGTVQLGLMANRPSDITVTLQPWFDDESLGDAVIGVVTSSDAHEAAWLAWRDDHDAPDNDPRSWIRHCMVFTGLEEGIYIGRADFSDRFEGDTLSLPEDRPYFSFLVAEPTDRGPVQTRRPTHLSGLFVDLLYVSVTRDPNQRVIGRAIAADASCDPGSDLDALYRSAPGVIQARITGDVEIPAERLRSPDYPWWPSHSRSVGMLLQLEEGTDYIVCLYWVNESGPAFAPRSIVLTEQIPVSTPSAYRPRITVRGIEDGIGAIESGAITEVVVSGRNFFPECRRDFRSFEGSTATREGRAFWFDTPLCAPQSGLWEVVNRGAMIVDTEVVYQGEGFQRGAYLRMDLLCATSPCAPRPPESALVPLPDVVTERRLCGTGFGGGCSGEIPQRRAGVVMLTIEYDITEGNGATSWQIGEPGAFRATPAPLPVEPRLAVRIEDRAPPPYAPPPSGVVIDAGLVITVDADRAVSWTATIEPATPGEPLCTVGPAPEPLTATMTAAEGSRPASVRFEVSGLCVGTAYSLHFTGSDAAGNRVLAMRTPADTPSPVVPMATAPLYLVVRGDLTVRVPQDGARYTVMPPTGFLDAPFVTGGLIPERGMRIAPDRLSFSPEARAELEENGWRPPFYGFQTCSHPNPGPWRVQLAGMGPVNQHDLLLQVEVVVHRNRPVGGSVVGECAVGDVIARHGFTQTVGIVDLWRGLSIVSEDGMAVLTLQATRWAFGDR